MSFLAPWLLFGTLLASVPVIIHLLNRRRVRRIAWAAMDFLLEAAVRSRKRLRVEDLLLMILRAAAILLFALALARPVFFGAGAAGGAEAVVLVDRSASMRYSEGAGTLFDFARGRVQEILSGLGRGGSVVVGAFDTEAQFPMGVEPTRDFGEVSRALAAMKPSWSPTDYGAALAGARRVSQGFPSRAPAVFIVSDFREGAALPGARPGRAKGGLFLVPVTASDGSSAGITGLFPAGALFTASRETLSARLANEAPRPAAASLSVSVDSAAAETTPVALEPYAAADATVSLPALAEPGVHLVEASLPADAYEADDTARAVVVRRPLKIALAAAGEARSFLEAAFFSAPVGAFEVTLAAGGAAAAGGSDGFIFAGEAPEGQEARAVLERVRAGAFAVVFADMRNAGAAASFLAAAGIIGPSEALAPLAGAGPFPPSLAGEHPVTRFAAGSEITLSNISLDKALDFRPSAENVQTPVVVSAASGETAFLALARLGAGGIAVFNTAADRSNGNFVAGPFFVPLLFETVAFLAGDPSAPFNGLCGEPLQVPAGASEAAVEVTGPDGTIEAALVEGPRGFAYSFTPPSPGFYHIAGSTAAVNVSAMESHTRLADRGSLERALGGDFVSADAPVAGAVARATSGVGISGSLLVAALAALALEMLVIYLARRSA